jgi:phosphoglucomutase
VDSAVILFPTREFLFFIAKIESVLPVCILVVLFSIFVYLNPPPVIIPIMSSTLVLKTEPTAPIAGQKTGTSGLRKQVHEVEQPHYLENWLESLFLALRETDGAGFGAPGVTLLVGGDGRYHNSKALQLIFQMAAAHGVARVVVGQTVLFSTPAVSALIRRRHAYGGIILTASHNPGGKEGDFGIKYNAGNGGPAPESLTNVIYKHTLAVTQFRTVTGLPHINLDSTGSHAFTVDSRAFTIDVIDSVDEYAALLREVFDFPSIARLFKRSDFTFAFDGLSGVAGPYAKRIFVAELGAPASALANCDPKEDFGGHHPDPNLTYAEELVALMRAGAFDFGAACDGDADRNMVLGKRFFVNPCDSVAIIAAHARRLPFYASQLRAVARSMPTSGALDHVARDLGVELYEVPTGWKYFGNIMDHHERNGAPNGVICGEESFGTGSSHVREKDGVWAVLAWLSIVALHNTDAAAPLVSVEHIVTAHWQKYGRNFFSRYDYENVTSESAAKVMALLASEISSIQPGTELAPGYKLRAADDFQYNDPFDKSVTKGQGIRFLLDDGSRFVFRLSGTGSSGATIRLYAERYVAASAPVAQLTEDAQIALKPIIQLALRISKLTEFTGRSEPSVIT